MFSNIGDKIKGLAVTVCVIGIMASALLAYNAKDLVIFAVGCVISWASTFVLYGFGELICRATAINEKLNEMEKTLMAICRIANEIKEK